MELLAAEVEEAALRGVDEDAVKDLARSPPSPPPATRLVPFPGLVLGLDTGQGWQATFLWVDIQDVAALGRQGW